MIKKLILLSVILINSVVAVQAQQRDICGVDLADKQILIEHPELAAKIAINHKLMEEQIANIARKRNTIVANNLNLAKITPTPPNPDSLGFDTFIIPVVVHVIHNYGTEDDVTDAQIATMIQNLNIYYNERNNLSTVITPFVKYIGKMRIGFHLATKDPTGQPTRGVTRRASYETYGGDNYAKYDLWDPSAYLNIWTEAFIGLSAEPGAEVVAYSQLPDVAAADPFIDGLITNAQFISNASESYVISHEVGHFLGLQHPFGNNNLGEPQPALPGGGCGDDGVDDTPPTTGEFNQLVCGPSALYDTMCATGYVKVSNVDSLGFSIDSITHAIDTTVYSVPRLIDYPDTANVQNIMTYSPCIPELMFTKGQVALVQGVLQSSLANRDSLSSVSNLINTGALDPLPILPPVADFSVNNHFVCEGTAVTFTNFSWNDTIKSVAWSLPSYASVPASTSKTSFTSTFSQPGWVNISLTANGTGGTTTLANDSTLYIADPATINPVGYFQEFAPNSNNQVDKYPMFNYYNNEFKWVVNSNTGYYDNSCVQYVGFDNRTFPANGVGLPRGDYDDMFTPAFDLTQLNGGSTPSLNFMFSAASLASLPADIDDTLEIAYSSVCSPFWTPLVELTGSSLLNKGAISVPYRPLYQGDWSLKNIPLINGTKNAVSSSTIFRFRYKPGVNRGYINHTANGISTGNNFYMDRLNFSNDPLGLNTLMPNDNSIVVAPNPTNSDAFVLIATKNNVTAQVQVTDIAGRVVYTAAQQTSGPLTRITIPRSVITATGMYLVHVIAGDQNQTEKLVVYQ